MNKINFSPFATNVLDMLNKTLADSFGNSYLIEKPANHFTIKMNGKIIMEHLDNIVVSNFLNTREIGIE